MYPVLTRSLRSCREAACMYPGGAIILILVIYNLAGAGIECGADGLHNVVF